LATAREQLYEEITAELAKAFGDDSDKTVREILKKYRVQTKPGVKIPDDRTARDALGDRILALWKKPPKDVDARIGTLIDEFRMQNKARGKATKKAAGKSAAKKKATPSHALSRSTDKPLPTPAEEKPRAPRRPAIEPAVRGGPRRRGKTRSECPKCKSMGVVLASSYAGDEYFSCIYCGWQAYKPVDEDDPNASLAVRLLGTSASKKKP
jgi:hypothetical protein